MGFFDHIFKRGKAYPSENASRLACELTMDGEKYLLDEFDMDFDTTGERRYVPMYAVLSEKLSPQLAAWITRDNLRKDGVVRFFRNADSLDEGAVFTFAFYGALCIKYRQSIRDDHPVVTLVLTAKHIRLEEEEYMIK